ncbi:hypothetical protein [Nocardiopsis sp. CA-288880]|uniref:hypothetical protein n=1 Tax=Nocardiopsis sp. CA-288880 TaxID=3239995 RepID=UPI003D96BF7B
MDSSYTMRNRRSPELRAAPKRTPRSRFAVADLVPAPAVPDSPPRPFGVLDRASIDTLVALVAEQIGSQEKSPRNKRSTGARRLLEHLATFKGSTWQDRWQASGLNEGGRPVSALVANKYHGYNMTHGLKALLCLRVIQPSLLAFRSNKFNQYPHAFREAQGDALLDTFFEQVARLPAQRKHQYRALFDVACALTTQGIALAALTPQALLYYAHECRRLGAVVADNGSGTTYPGLMAWDVLHGMGHFPPGTAPTLRTYIYKGQRTVEEMVDFYQVSHPGVRDLLITYLTRRKADTDYNTREGLARVLAGSFWHTIEKIAPEQQDLRLPQEVYDQWR